MNNAEKFIKANNLLQFIHQVTIEFRFQKSSAQERFKSNLEFRYQIIVLSIKFRKGFAKFMIPIVLFKKFLSEKFIANVEVSNIARCSSKTNKLRDIDYRGCRARNVTILKWEIYHFKIKVVTFIINFGRKNIIRN